MEETTNDAEGQSFGLSDVPKDGSPSKISFCVINGNSLEDISNGNRSSDLKRVWSVHMIDALLKEIIASNGIATACSFATNLTTLSFQL